jgi:hypothetical protein
MYPLKTNTANKKLYTIYPFKPGLNAPDKLKYSVISTIIGK